MGFQTWRSLINLHLVAAVTTALLLLTVIWFGKHRRISCWFTQIFSLEGSRHSAEAKEWSEKDERSAVFSMQGKRDNNEDRAVMRTVRMLEDIDKTEVHVWAVMDGHGGQFCADYCEEHLVPSLVTAIQKLKLLTSSLENNKKLGLYEKHYKEISKGVLKYLQISETEYNSRQRNPENNIKR